jgi:hypothetical protein
MSDPERLIEKATDLRARLLTAGLDEAPPPELLAKTLAVVGAAAPVAAGAALAGKAASAALAGKAASGGVLSAALIGALAGVLTVGGYEAASARRAPPAPSATVAAAQPPSLPAPTAAPPAPPPAPVAAEPAAAPSAAPTASALPRAAPLVREIELLDEARAALDRGDRAGALAALDRYAREAPRGQMAREAAVLRARVSAKPDPEKTIP